MLYEWHWTTYIVYVIVGFIFLYSVKQFGNANKMSYETAESRQKNNRIGYFIFAYLVLMSLPVFRNIDIYPSYAPGIRTIDPQGYTWMILHGGNPEFHILKMLTLQQTEPLMYTIAHFILKIGGNMDTVWFVLFSMVVICYIYFFRYTLEKDINCWLLFPFISLFLYAMCGVRSGLSMAFFYAAMANLKRNKKLAMILCLIIGFSFHYIIIFGIAGFLFDYLLEKIPYKKEFVIACVCVVALGTVILKSGLAEMISKTKYFAYLQIGGSTVRGQMPEIVLFTLCLINYKKIKKRFPDRMMYVNIVFFNMVCVPLIIMFDIYRVSMYFLLARIYVWSMLIQIYEDKYKYGGHKIIIKVGNYRNSIYACIGVIFAFLWFTKQVYDMRGNGIMPLFNIYI